MKNKKILTKKLFEATYVADNAEDVKKLKASGVLAKDDTVNMIDDKGTSTSPNDSTMALKEENNKKEYHYDGKDYTKDELIDFVQAASEYDRRDADEKPIDNIKDALTWLGNDVKKINSEPITVEYLSNMKGEKPFEINGDKYEYVYGRYPDGKREPAVYCFKNEMTVSYAWFVEHILKYQNIQENDKQINENDYDFDTTNLYKFLKDALYQLDDLPYYEGAKILEEELLKHFDINKKQLGENSGINRPKDAKGNDIVLKHRVKDIESGYIGHVIRFGLDDNGQQIVQVDWMRSPIDSRGPSKNVLPNTIVVDDNSRIVREQDTSNTNDIISFQLAKILKEKDFHKPAKAFYTMNGELSTKAYRGTNVPTADYNAYPKNFHARPFYKYGFSAPTIDVVLNWFKEKYNIELHSEYQVLQFFTNNLNEQDNTLDNVNIPKLQQDVKILVDKIETVLKPYLNKIDKPVEQAELIAAIAERIGIPREKLSGIIGKLKTISTKTNTQQQDVTSTSQVNENRKVIKTIKKKDILKK